MYKMKSDINFSLTHEMLENAENERIHTSYAQEKAILECVSNGDIHALENTYYSLPTTVYGKMTSSNSKLKLLFYASIANTTLVTRYAIEGGLNEETAFSLYIPFQVNHLHGQTEPVPRRMRATLTETEPVLFDVNYQATAC